MLNKIILVGRLTAIPKSIKLNEKNTVLNFSLALNRQYSKKDTTDFINCVAWNKTATLIEKHLTKGALIAIVGRLIQDRYKAADGTNRSQLKVICENVQFLESKAMLEERKAFQKDLDETLDEINDELENKMDDIDF